MRAWYEDISGGALAFLQICTTKRHRPYSGRSDGKASAAVLLFQADACAGHEPANRRVDCCADRYKSLMGCTNIL